MEKKEWRFRKLGDGKEIDVIKYVEEFLAKNPNSDLLIGCDSHNTGRLTHYATVIVLHESCKGGHVLYDRRSFPRIYDKFTRLFREVELSVDIAELLKEAGVQKPKYIDIDLNPDPKFQSNTVLRAALGFVTSMGYTPRCKPDGVIASRVADALCK
jgi:predicted RNase H-related nuclease YkuK (DUF458 family)